LGRPTDRRTRGRDRRRDALYTAAIGAFIEKGFDNTTMDDVAERADVARATVFNHFSRKTAFIDEWTARRRRSAFAAVRSRDLEGAPLPDVLALYFTELASISTANRVETVALMSAAVHSTNILGRPELAVELSRFVEQARKDGEIDAQTDAKRVGLLLASAYFAVLTAWIDEDPAPFDLTEELLAVLHILLAGVMSRGPKR
jgi:AcrR family transcriptional regulator